MPTSDRLYAGPVAGQAAALIQSETGVYMQRYPFDIAGGRERALQIARDWRDAYAPGAAVLAFTGEMTPRFDFSDGLKTYTAFVRQTDRRGTLWIQDVQGHDIAEAELAAETECAAAWDFALSEVECIGLAEGSITLANWND